MSSFNPPASPVSTLLFSPVSTLLQSSFNPPGVQFQPSCFSPVSTLLPTRHYTLSPPLVYCNEGVFIMFIDKVGIGEACRHGLSVSLSITPLNGQESFFPATILGPHLVGRPERRRRPRGGRRQRRRGYRGIYTQQVCSHRTHSPTSCCYTL